MKIAQWVKGVIAGIGGVAGVLVPLLDDGQITGAEWGTLVVAVLVALGVMAAPNAVTPQQYRKVAGEIAAAPVEDVTGR